MKNLRESERDVSGKCPSCKKKTTFTLSGSGKKGYCMKCDAGFKFTKGKPGMEIKEDIEALKERIDLLLPEDYKKGEKDEQDSPF